MTFDPNQYLILIEGDGSTNYGAWSPDLLGCVSTGATIEATVANMREAIGLHLELMAEDGDPIPEPSGPGVYLEHDAAAA